MILRMERTCILPSIEWTGREQPEIQDCLLLNWGLGAAQGCLVHAPLTCQGKSFRFSDRELMVYHISPKNGVRHSKLHRTDQTCQWLHSLLPYLHPIALVFLCFCFCSLSLCLVIYHMRDTNGQWSTYFQEWDRVIGMNKILSPLIYSVNMEDSWLEFRGRKIIYMCALDTVALEVFSVSYCLLIYSASIYWTPMIKGFVLNFWDTYVKQWRGVLKLWDKPKFFFVEVNHIN